MRVILNGNNYNLKFKTEEIAPTLETFPAALATKTLGELSAKEIETALSRAKRNLRKQSIRKGTTMASLFEVNAEGAEKLVCTVTVTNHKNDEFSPSRGRREAFLKLRDGLPSQIPNLSKQVTRDLTEQFYTRFPKSRPHYEDA